MYRCEAERMDFNAEGSDVLLLELACQMALDEGGLRRQSVGADEIRVL